jgi:hypothetical protein
MQRDNDSMHIDTARNKLCVYIIHNLALSLDLANQSLETKHSISIRDTKILAMVDHYSKFRIREAIEIEKHAIFKIEMMI